MPRILGVRRVHSGHHVIGRNAMRTSTTRTIRRLVGPSIVALGVLIPAGVAGAADAYPSGNPPAVSGTSLTNGSTVKAATTTNTSTLPFTGGDVAGLALIGAGAVLAGTVIVRRSRRPAGV
jgi:hypothetical protein